MSSSLAGLEQAVAKLEAIGQAVTVERLKGPLMDGAEAGAQVVRANAPYDSHRPPKKAGEHIRDAVFVTPGPADKPNVLMGVNRSKAPQGVFLEFGTSRMPPHPFFRSSITSAQAEMVGIATQGFKALIEDAAK